MSFLVAQEPTRNPFSTRLSNIDITLSNVAVASLDNLDKEPAKTPLTGTHSIATSSKTRVSSKNSSCENLSSSFQTAIMSLILENKVVIKAHPEPVDFSSYTIKVSGNDHSLETDERFVKGKNNKNIFLRSYKTNILKIKRSTFKPWKKNIFLYSSDKVPTKLGKVKKARNFSDDLNIYNSDGKLIYTIQKEKYEPKTPKGQEGGFLSSLICSAKKRNVCGRLNLVYHETNRVIDLGSYCTLEIFSKQDEQSLKTLSYELDFPNEITEEAKMLITAALISEIPRTVCHKGKF